MKRNLLVVSSLAVCLLMVTRPIFAHHSTAVEDKDHITTLTGTVTEWMFTNPHPSIHFTADVKDNQGNQVQWIASEGGGVVRLHKAGWTTHSLQPGDRILVQGHQLKNGRPVMSWRTLYRCNTGEKMELGYGPNDAGIDEYRSHVKFEPLAATSVKNMCSKGTLETR